MTTAHTSTRALDEAPPTVRRRRGLPGARPLVGAALVTFAALVTVVAYTGADEAPSDEVVVLRRPLDVGHRIAANDVRVERVELPDELHAQVATDVDEVAGAVALGPLGADQMVPRTALLPPDETSPDPGPTFEVSLPVEASRALGGDVVAGELVDVVATFGSSDSAYSLVVASRARVLGTSERAAGVGGSDLVLHLALSSADEVMATAHASAAASVTVVRATRAAEVPITRPYQPTGPSGPVR